VPLISRVSDEKTEVRRAAIEALRGIGDRRAVVAVVAAFGDGNVEVRKAAVVTAGKLGDPRRSPRDPDAARPAARRAQPRGGRARRSRRRGRTTI
jgi:HEAT repeat protein